MSFMRALVISCLLVGSAAGEELAVVLKLNGTLTDAAQLNYESLPRLTGTHAVVCEPTPELKFQLHNYLVHHDGRYWCLFSHGPIVEDVPTQHCSYSTSTDGVTWSPARPVMPPPEDPYAYIARGLWVYQGELLALVAHYKGKGAFGVDKELKLEAYAWDPAAESWKFKTVLYEDAINNFEPQKLPSGAWLMTRRDARFNVSMLMGGVKALDDWQVFPVMQRLEFKPLVPDEPFCLMLPDGRVHALFRDNGGSQKLFQSFSKDEGRTWSRPELTNFPNSTSKCYPLRLQCGAWVLISNANPKWGRREMYLSVSEDGLTFQRMARLEIPSKVATTFQYPHAIEHDGHLLIAFSNKKARTETLKVPLKQIEALRK